MHEAPKKYVAYSRKQIPTITFKYVQIQCG